MLDKVFDSEDLKNALSELFADVACLEYFGLRNQVTQVELDD